MKNSLKKGLKIGTGQLILLCCSVVVGFLLLVLVYLIPQEAVYDNAKESVEMLYKEWSRNESCQQWMGINGTVIDYFTDGLIFNTTYTENGNFLEDVLLANRVTYEWEISPMTSLYSFLIDKDQDYFITDYARYWHGYQAVLRPLLVLMSASSIRFLNMTVQISLVILLLVMLVRTQKENLVLPYLVMWMSLIPSTLFACFQYSSAFYATVITSLLVVFFWQREKGERLFGKLCLAFELGGILLAYFDILTYPLVVLGVPLILYFSMDAGRMEGFVVRCREILAFSVSWVVGYGGMWFGKWLLASLLTGSNMIKSAIETVLFRTSHEYGDKKFTWLGTIQANLSYMKNGVFVILIAAAVVLFLACCVKYRLKLNLPVFFAICLVSVYPFLWYFFAMNHSYLHAVFTWRELVISVYGFVSLLYVNVTNVLRKNVPAAEREG